ncbi:diguanylate cyclase [Chromatium okenii]|uniref:EAL domain-containing protein n=1 Tax=Chromatium okenii TaxID=61644 RepID=UPI0019062909|nr:EAL domain-containing protein [Chromatium okenii]MBK1642084.1 diguanylate cyclase [Chromatium okenii]
MSATLLIVDDVPENLAILGELLRGVGYRVRAANSGAVALKYALLEPQPDLILLDLMMPEMDGREVLTRLRADPRTADIPVIFVTAMDSAEAETLCLEQGAADFIAKPLIASIVLARVHNQLELQRVRNWLLDQNAFLESEIAQRVAEVQEVQDASARAQAHLTHRMEMILNSTGEGIQGLDLHGDIDFVNPAAAAMLGYQPEELIGQKFHERVHHPQDVQQMCNGDECHLAAAVRTGTVLENYADHFYRRDGICIPVEYSCMPLFENGVLQGAVIAWRDISERNSYLEQIERQSNFDELTGLPNRNLLYDRLTQALERSRADHSALTVLTLSLDRFKSINAHLGRGAGDQALRAVANRLISLLAVTDTLARVEGDEFILVAKSDERDVVGRYAQPILETVQVPLWIDAHEIVLSVSIGIATFPRDGDNRETLLRNATAAMTKIKVSGGQGFRFYAPEMNALALERLDLEAELRDAIKHNGLALHYQPQIDLRNGQIIGAEALARWPHPRRGWISPGEFIPLAEECGLIWALGEWVLREACRQNQAWQDAGLPPVTVAVNLSALQFVAGDVVEMTAMILRETRLAPEYLELELTESAAMTDMQTFIEATKRLKGLSVSLSIDDFGTGFSSLSYLRQFQIDRLKIDQSFVRDIVQDPSSAAIITAIINLAHGLNLAAIAEGVETEAQLQFLRAHDCDEMQGYYFSRPLAASDFEVLLRSERLLVFPNEALTPQRTLLLVDDDPHIRFVLERLFTHEGYRVLPATSGVGALELLALHEVDVVVSDGDMPEMDGAELLRRISAMYPHTLRILLSGALDPQFIARSVNQGDIFKFLPKPWKTAELREAVREAFRIIEARAGRPLASSGGKSSFNPGYQQAP